MKHRQKRMLSLMLSGVMTASLLPSYLTQLSIPAAADDSTASDFVPDTDPTIDFDYAVNHNILSADDALKDLAKQNKAFKWVKSGTDKELLDTYNLYPWQHATNITISDWDEGSLRTYLESDAPEDKYVAISEDECDTWTDMDKDWEPVKITTDKVLDLNGHKLEIQYYSNKSNKHNDYGHVEDGDWISAYDERGRQNHDNIDSHMAHCFEIEDGATLTIIDSSAWRGENKGEGTGSIEFDGYMVNHIECDGHPDAWDVDYYTNRDLFWVQNGNLVVYGGHFQAGRKQTQGGHKSNFSWDKLKTVVGNAVELGVSIAEYATGVNTAVGAYQDVLSATANSSVINASGDTSEKEIKPKDAAAKEPEPQKQTPGGAATRDLNISEKVNDKDTKLANGKPGQGTPEGDNHTNEENTAKDDKNTKIAKAQNDIVNAAVNKSGITGMVDNAFSLVENICGLFSSSSTERATTSIKGTVVRVGNSGTFVSYGGHYEAYGSTPNVRKACVEVSIDRTSTLTFDKTKQNGGLVYVFDGYFEANSGANVFNFFKATPHN